VRISLLAFFLEDSGRLTESNSWNDLEYIQSGWWYTYPSEKYEFVSWNDDTPNLWKIGGWPLTYPSEKYESQMIVLFPIYGKS
jgi:hypothetical protein